MDLSLSLSVTSGGEQVQNRICSTVCIVHLNVTITANVQANMFALNECLCAPTIYSPIAGLVFHQNDLPSLSDYIVANMHRKPPDWLMTEWYKGLTYTAKMAIGGRHRGFTHRLNVFEHIGNHSSFPGRQALLFQHAHLVFFDYL